MLRPLAAIAVLLTAGAAAAQAPQLAPPSPPQPAGGTAGPTAPQLAPTAATTTGAAPAAVPAPAATATPPNLAPSVPRLVPAPAAGATMPLPNANASPAMQRALDMRSRSEVQRRERRDMAEIRKSEPALDRLARWFDRSSGVLMEGGVVKFPHGQVEPVVICSPLRICQIELEPGERVDAGKIVAGDTANWHFIPGQTNVGGQTAPVVVLKLNVGSPDDVPYIPDSSLSIMTDRRVYSVTLKAAADDYMPRVGFYYPQDAVVNWVAQQQSGPATRPSASAGASGSPAGIATVDASKANFGYRIEGDNAPFKPLKVFDDGKRVFVQMPEITEMPVFTVTGMDGNTELVNFRVREGYIIVDALFREAQLTLGSPKQDPLRVKILRDGKDDKCLFFCGSSGMPRNDAGGTAGGA